MGACRIGPGPLFVRLLRHVATLVITSRPVARDASMPGGAGGATVPGKAVATRASAETVIAPGIEDVSQSAGTIKPVPLTTLIALG